MADTHLLGLGWTAEEAERVRADARRHMLRPGLGFGSVLTITPRRLRWASRWRNTAHHGHLPTRTWAEGDLQFQWYVIGFFTRARYRMALRAWCRSYLAKTR